MNACGHTAASQKVLDQIDGRGIAAVCNADLSGVWIGEISDYFNNPFVMDLLQTGNSLSGTYKDKNDEGYVTGTVIGDRVEMRVGFGDTGFLVEREVGRHRRRERQLQDRVRDRHPVVRNAPAAVASFVPRARPCRHPEGLEQSIVPVGR